MSLPEGSSSVYIFALLISLSVPLLSQEYSVKAVEENTGKPLKGIPITLRYDCTSTESGTKLKIHCKFMQRGTDADGVAHFPEAGSLKAIDDIYSLPIKYGMVCCDISHPTIPGTDTMKFRQRTFGEMLHWIFIGN